MDIQAAITIADGLENYLKKFREEFQGEIHPWSLLPLANAIGSVRACQSHLRAVKHAIETPNPPIDAEFEIVK